MSELMPIGRFARLTGLSPRALRLYDERKLLSPAVIDFSSGYRYYRQEQVLVARRIQILRALEMPLADIRALLTTTDTTEARARLARHKATLDQRVANGQRALESIRALDQGFMPQGQEETMTEQSKSYACSFCGKPAGEVTRLIAGPKGVFICDECVDLCNKIIAPDPEESGAHAPS